MTLDLEWPEKGQTRRARWRSEAALPPPKNLQVVDGPLDADTAFGLLSSGEALLWRGDWMEVRQLMQALTRRADRLFCGRDDPPASPPENFARHRQRQGLRAGLLARLLVPLGPDYKLPLRRAQDVRPACREAWGKPDGNNSVVALRELLAVISAHEWRKKGIHVSAIDGRIHPHYGVFSPVRGEYVDLAANAPLPADRSLAFDIGVGSGILSAILARRGMARVIATDQDDRALACAAENLEKHGFTATVELQKTDLFPQGRAGLIVCNPPWLPAQPSSPIEYAVYDPDSRMLRGFLAGLAEHLTDDGEGWLIISDLAEHLGLRGRPELMGWIAAAGLRVIERRDTRPKHPKASDASDPLYAARAAEVTSLWRLCRAS